MNVRSGEGRAESSERRLRTIGLVLVLAGMSVTVVVEQLAHWRARLQESRTKVLVRLSEPGSIVTLAGISLLEASDSRTKGSAAASSPNVSSMIRE